MSRSLFFKDQESEVQAHELRRQKLPTEPRVGQVTCWHQKPEV